MIFFACHKLWQDLAIDKALKRARRSSRREFDDEVLIPAMVFNHLYDWVGKLDCLRWLETVAMPLLPKTVTHQHLLRAMDALMDNAETVEEALTRQIRPLVDRAVVFYGLTTVRIYGGGDVDDDFCHRSRNTAGGIAKLFANGCKEQWVVWSGGHLKGIAIPKIVGIRSGVAV